MRAATASTICAGGLVFREEAPEFPGEKLRTRGLFHQDIDDVIAVPRAGFSHECFRAGIVLPRSEPKLLVRHVDSITGEGARRFSNVGFGVMPDPDGEKLHQFPRPIFVRVLFPALLQIEVDHHRGVARDLFRERGKISERVAAERVVLPPHPVAVLHFLDAGGEVAVPEERHLFDERRGRRHHVVEPPTPQIEDVLAFHLTKFAPLVLAFVGLVFLLPNRHADFANVSRLSPGRSRRGRRAGGGVDQFAHNPWAVLSRAQLRSPRARHRTRRGLANARPSRNSSCRAQAE